jgi:DNA-directed RNA polymerase subunit RPC12/RpoP
VEYAPGTNALRCPYCGFEQPVPATQEVVEEASYAAWAALPPKPTGHVAPHVLQCSTCGAQTESEDLSDRCPFCGAPIVAQVQAGELIAPEAVVPFDVDQRRASEAIIGWVRSRWFAPNKLKKVGAAETLKGTYLPHWTFDAETETDYTGQRGEHYYTTETYTVTVDGRQETRTRQVQHTAWYPASGHVARDFDDVLVPGTTKLSPERLEQLAPWPLERAVAYQPDYLSGYRTLRYDVQPDGGLQGAKQLMESVVEQDCRDDIGGDVQRVQWMNVQYANVMFKLVLLPVWIAAYVYAGRTFQVMVNAHTGEVVGERPYSKVKIAFAVLAALIVAAVALYLYGRTRR